LVAQIEGFGHAAQPFEFGVMADRCPGGILGDRAAGQINGQGRGKDRLTHCSAKKSSMRSLPLSDLTRVIAGKSVHLGRGLERVAFNQVHLIERNT